MRSTVWFAVIPALLVISIVLCTVKYRQAASVAPNYQQPAILHSSRQSGKLHDGQRVTPTVHHRAAPASKPTNLSTLGLISTMPQLSYKSPIVVKPTAAHNSTVIMLHGLGDQGHGWSEIAGEFASVLPSAKFLFPHAPNRSITLNFGMSMPGW